MLKVRPLQVGGFPVIGARLPKEHARTLRVVASRSGVPLQAIMRALVADWIDQGAKVEVVNPSVNPVQAIPAPLVSIPTTHDKRQETGKAAETKGLMAIDTTRKKNRDAKKNRD